MPRTPGNSRGPRWPGPPGLTPAEKKRWAEQQRRAALRAAGLMAGIDAAAWQRRRQTQDPNVARDRQRERRFRWRSAKPHAGRELKIRSADELRRPRFTWIDRHGEIHAELWETPDELAARILEVKTSLPPKERP